MNSPSHRTAKTLSGRIVLSDLYACILAELASQSFGQHRTRRGPARQRVLGGVGSLTDKGQSQLPVSRETVSKKSSKEAQALKT